MAQKKTFELAEQIRAITIAEKSREESEAKASADRACAEAVKAEADCLVWSSGEQRLTLSHSSPTHW